MTYNLKDVDGYGDFQSCTDKHGINQLAASHGFYPRAHRKEILSFLGKSNDGDLDSYYYRYGDGFFYNDLDQYESCHYCNDDGVVVFLDIRHPDTLDERIEVYYGSSNRKVADSFLKDCAKLKRRANKVNKKIETSATEFYSTPVGKFRRYQLSSQKLLKEIERFMGFRRGYKLMLRSASSTETAIAYYCDNDLTKYVGLRVTTESFTYRGDHPISEQIKYVCTDEELKGEFDEFMAEYVEAVDTYNSEVVEPYRQELTFKKLQGKI